MVLEGSELLRICWLWIFYRLVTAIYKLYREHSGVNTAGRWTYISPVMLILRWPDIIPNNKPIVFVFSKDNFLNSKGGEEYYQISSTRPRLTQQLVHLYTGSWLLITLARGVCFKTWIQPKSCAVIQSHHLERLRKSHWSSKKCQTSIYVAMSRTILRPSLVILASVPWWGSFGTRLFSLLTACRDGESCRAIEKALRTMPPLLESYDISSHNYIPMRLKKTYRRIV